MKKLISILIVGLLTCSVFLGCNASNDNSISSREIESLEGKEKYFFDLVESLFVNGESEYWGLSYDDLNSVLENLLIDENIGIGGNGWYYLYLDDVDSLFNDRVSLDGKYDVRVDLIFKDQVPEDTSPEFCKIIFEIEGLSSEDDMEIFNCLEKAFAESSMNYKDYNNDLDDPYGCKWYRYGTEIYMDINHYDYTPVVKRTEIIFEKHKVKNNKNDDSDGVIGDNDYDGDVDEEDWEEEWNNYLDNALEGY